jgi:hypothetical protein
MKQGDICVQRGTMHAWVPRGPGPAVFAFILIDADPVAAGWPQTDDALPGAVSGKGAGSLS